MDHYALIGNPIHHSRSPDIHRLFAEQTGQSLIYTAIQVSPLQLATTLDDFQSHQGRGLNVTAPLKTLACPLVHHLSPRAKLAGAINTITFQPDGTRLGDNTDGVGLIRDITLNQKVSLNDATILLLGAGGAAHGILAAILDEQPAQVTLANRTVSKAQQLAATVASTSLIQVSAWPTTATQTFDIIINATSPTDADFRLPAGFLTPDTYCYDLVYGKLPTPFLRWARKQGCERYNDGLGMLVEQAAESFYIWRQVRPDPVPVLNWLKTAL
jgi:shikimate dehydrogenase